MHFSEIRAGNRLLIESEHKNPIYRSVRGIVLAVDNRTILLVADFGELIELHESSILSVTQVSFPRIVGERLVDLKNYYEKCFLLENELEELKQQKEPLIKSLFDANFLSKFNINGAKIRLENSIDKELLEFKRKMFGYKVGFKGVPGNQMEMVLTVSNYFEYYNLEEVGNAEKIVRSYAPDAKKLIAKSFPFSESVKELEKRVVHIEGDHYSVESLYVITIDMNEDNFLEQRDKIIAGLKKLKN